MLRAKMMELGDIFMVEGLSERASKKLETPLAPEPTRNLVVDMVRLEIRFVLDSSIIQKIIVHSLRKKLHPPPLATDIVETMAEVVRVGPEFGNDMLMSYCNASNYGASFRWAT
ncbi:hypothetical protein E4U56_007585 [Claviceps arundinis]|uniref:Uncharacterized protein n=1 Tax=Claviceps arundinis TaxID=1623583 RepID=A0A9P7SRQ5_9HYPO|nr:hypothetical protein E4U56_007585 [Claviceps arundinis]